MAITSGHDVRTVAGRLGHANPAMTLRVCAHAVEGADQALAATLASALEGGNHPAPVGASAEHSTGTDVLARLGIDSAAVDEFCRRNGIGRLAVFGSALRDDFTPESDVDFLVDFLPGQKVSLFDIARVEPEWRWSSRSSSTGTGSTSGPRAI